MKRFQKAFTLIEVLICLAIIAVTFFPFMIMTDRLYVAYHKSLQRSALQAELEGLSYRIQGQLRAHPDYRIDADNRGASWRGGGLRWEGERLFLQVDGKQVILSENVALFSLHRRTGRTYVSLARRSEHFREPQRLTLRVEKL